jgi:F0F1-type ATP synthase membrane subunit b/b'
MNTQSRNTKQKKKTTAKSILKKIGLGFLIILVLLIGTAIAIPYFFKDKIIAKVEEEINKNVNAKVSFKDVNLSLFRSFPDFSFRLEELEVMGVEEFEGLRLLGVKNFDIRLDLMKVINGKYEVQGIRLDEPNIFVKVLKNGKANYDIAKPSTDTTTTPTDTSSTDFLVKLESYEIRNGNLTYDDHTINFFADIYNLNHKGRGDFSSMVYDLKTKTTVEGFTVAMGGINYLNKVKTDIDLDIKVDLENMKFTISDNTIKMNALTLVTEGSVEMPGNDIKMDLAMRSPKSEFKHLLSMIPAAYTADFDDVKASGKMGFDAKIKGIYNETSLPSFQVNLLAENANFQYPDLPSSVDNINIKMNVNSPSSDMDKMVVDIKKFTFDIEGSKVDAMMLLKTPMSDPDIKATIDGKIVLDQLAKAFPLQESGIQELKGTIVADLKTATKMSMVTNEQYEEVDMAGKLKITGMNYLATGMPKVTIKDLSMIFTPKNIQLAAFDALLGKSDLKVSGTLDNFLTYFSGTKTMKGNLVVRSNKLDANEWMASSAPAEENPNAPTANIEDTTTVASETGVFDKFDFVLDAEMKDIVYDIYHITNNIGKGHFTPNKMEFQQLSTQMGKSDFLIQGSLTNVFGYLFDNGTLGGTALLRSKFMDANELMDLTSPPTAKGGGEEEGEAPKGKDVASGTPNDEVFGRFNVNADVNIGKLIYDTYKITNITGIGNFKHDIFKISDFGMQIGNSDLKATGVIQHAIDYMYNNGKVKGAIDMSSNFFDLNQFMVASPAPATATSPQLPPAQPASTANLDPYLVPDNMDILINAHMKKVLYDKMELKNANGQLIVENEAVSMSDVKADVFGGQINIVGGYDTKNKEKPKFDFGLNIKNFFLNQAFNQLNTVQAIAPIAKFVEGKFNTDLSINGVLGKDMMPDYKTLNSEGLLETLDAVIKNFKPVNEMAKKLNVKDLEQLAIKNTKNRFSIKNGAVVVKPFDLIVKVKEDKVAMNIGGSHSINQDMNYDIKMTIPRALLEKSKATAVVNTGIDLLSGQATKLGLNLKQGENINLLVNLLGNLMNPQVKVKLLGMDGSNVVTDATNQVKNLTEEAKKKAQATADSLKRVGEAKAQQELNKLKNQAQARADSLKQVAKQKAEEELKKITEQAKKDAANKVKEVVKDKVSDEVKDAAKNKVNEVKDKVGKDVQDKAKDELDKLKNKFKLPKKDN